MITVEGESIGIKATGKKADVPDNPMGRLMYYLKIVNTLVDFQIPFSLRNYAKYNLLSFDDENRVLTLAILLSPDIFIEKGIMINEPQLCINSSNTFYEISAMHSAIAITEEFVIGGQQVHTLKIMAFKKSWLTNTYTIPINTYSGRILAIANGTVEKYRPKSIVYQAVIKRPISRHSQFEVFPPRDGAIVLVGDNYSKSRPYISDSTSYPRNSYDIETSSPPLPKRSKCCLLI